MQYFGVSIERLETKIQEAVEELQKEFRFLINQNLQNSAKICDNNMEHLHKIFRSELADRFNLLNIK